MARFERWLEVKRIFEEVKEVAPKDQEAFLDHACAGDTDLRREIEALLNAPPIPTSSLLGLLGLPEKREEPGYAEGDTIDHFVIVRCIDNGGMGVVYEARDTRNNYRPVAIKVLFSRAVKFSQDKKIAGFTHPSIVTFHDSGETSEGLPYFVFEYIEGEPITTFCKRRNLGIADRLLLFVKACSAVQYAHQRLVIHCDLKPENILVTATGELKLLDFGIAKEVGDIRENLEYPSPMTLPFASPEQVGREATTTLSDVYSLGLLLCVLLTGRLPYTHTSTVADFRNAILHDRPSPPSELVGIKESEEVKEFPLSSPPPELHTLKLAKRLRGDLDAIVLKALRKSPEERYAAVKELSDDIENYLYNRPVIARNGSWHYRAAKLFKRHLVGASLSAIMVLGASIFLATLAYQYREIVHQRDEAQQQAARAEKVSLFLTNLFRLSDPARKPDGGVTARELLDKAAANLPQELKNQPETLVPLLNTLGVIYGNLGLMDQSGKCHRLALRVAQEHFSPNSLQFADTLFFLALFEDNVGNYREAEALHRRALKLRWRNLPHNHLSIANSLYGIGVIAANHGRLDEAERYYKQALDIQESAPAPDEEAVASYTNAMGLVLLDKERYKEAEDSLKTALRLRTRMYGESHPLVATALNNLAIVMESENRLDEAEQLKRKALAINKRSLGADHPNVAVSLSNLGFLLLKKGDQEHAVVAFSEALGIAKKVFGVEHPTTIVIQINLAKSLRLLGRLSEADTLLHEVYDPTLKILGKDDITFGNLLKTQAEIFYDRSEFQKAEAKFEQAIDTFRAAEGDSSYRALATRAELGSCFVHQQRFAEAEPILLAYQERAKEGDKPEAIERLYGLYKAWGKTDAVVRYRRIIAERYPSHLNRLHP